MKAIRTKCPRCGSPLEIASDFDSVICTACSTVYNVRRAGGAINLVEIEPGSASEPLAIIDSRLAELDELIEQAHSESEAIRSREKSAPLQFGCAFFGLFMMVIVVIALFMLLGKGYFGHWLFYLSIVAVILLGLARIRRKLAGRTQIEELRQERLKLEEGLAQLEVERDRVARLKTSLSTQEPDNETP